MENNDKNNDLFKKFQLVHILKINMKKIDKQLIVLFINNPLMLL